MRKFRRGFTEIEEQARRLRQRLGVDALLAPDLIEAFQKLPQIFPGFRLTVVADSELPDCEAEADCYRKCIIVRQSVYEGCLSGQPHARMTFAHELAHIALGHSGTRFRRANASYHGLADRTRRIEESEATQFAGVFLAPTYLALEYDSPERMVEAFGISREAAEIRCGQLSTLKEREGPLLTKSVRQRGEPQVDTPTSRSKGLPESAIDFLTEAKRRGHRVTALDGLDETKDDNEK